MNPLVNLLLGAIFTFVSVTQSKNLLDIGGSWCEYEVRLSASPISCSLRSHTVLVDLREYHYKWRCNKIVDRQDGNQEVPGLAEVALGVNQVPLDLLLIVNDLVVVILVVLDIVNHHLSEVLLRHLLESGLKAQFVIVTSGLGP